MKNTSFIPEFESNDSEGKFPKTLNEFKASKKYILKFQLKKFEAFDPAKDVVVGYFGDEEIHKREAISKVRSKEAWLTQFGRTLIAGTKPIKEYELKHGAGVKKQYLYGVWQTEAFQPPSAENVTSNIAFLGSCAQE